MYGQETARLWGHAALSFIDDRRWFSNLHRWALTDTMWWNQCSICLHVCVSLKLITVHLILVFPLLIVIILLTQAAYCICAMRQMLQSCSSNGASCSKFHLLVVQCSCQVQSHNCKNVLAVVTSELTAHISSVILYSTTFAVVT